MNGELFYYPDNKTVDRPLGGIRLLGSEIQYAGGTFLEIYNKKSDRRMFLKCGSTAELEHWKRHLDLEANPGKVPDGRGGFSSPDGSVANKVETLRERSSTIIYDIGGASVRAGFAGNLADASKAWPEVFEPACVSRKGGSKSVGMDALTPEARNGAKTTYPFRMSESMDQKYDMKSFEDICEYVSTSKSFVAGSGSYSHVNC